MDKLKGYEQKIDNNHLLSVQVNLLNECTSHCKSCRKYTWPKDVLRLADLKRAILALKNMGLETLVFSGGDPILYNDLSGLMLYCNFLDIKFSLITTLITEDAMLVRDIAHLAERIHVSLDAANRQLYKRVRGVDGLESALNNIAYVGQVRKKRGLRPIRLSSTISKMNYEETYNLYKLAELHGCDINFYLIHTWDDLKMSGCEVDRFYDMLRMIYIDEHNKPENKRIKTNAADLLKSLNEGDVYEVKNCMIPKIHALINADGDIYPCCKLLNDNGEYRDQSKYAYGNIYARSIFNEFEKRLEIKYPLDCELCKECSDRYKPIIKYINETKEERSLFL